MTFNHLKKLESESIYIIREVAAEFTNPVMLYSIGKDSSVMLHLAIKAFAPNKIPFKLLHVDTTWKFKEMIKFRDQTIKEKNLDLIVHINQEGVNNKVGPITHGSKTHTDIMKTQSLKQALNKYKFDAAFGGARRDEEKSRAKERIFSFRDTNHRWDPKNQRPELWNLFNGRKGPGENFRVFPLSNWTEMDVWQYAKIENIELPSLYFSHEREVLERNESLLAVSDFVIPNDNETASKEVVRFRTIGDATCTGAVKSNASTLDEVIAEVAASRITERGSRADDRRSEAAMEDRKKQGYF